MDVEEAFAPAEKRQFCKVSDVMNADVAKAEEVRVPNSTKTATAFWVRVLTAFCR